MWLLGKQSFVVPLGAALLLGLVGCRRSHVDATPAPEPQPVQSAAPVVPAASDPALRVLVAYSSEKAPWVHAEQKQGAELFLAQLKRRPAQERALALGSRPADPGLPVTGPIDAEHGCDPKQPQTTLAVPSAEVLKKLLGVFSRGQETQSSRSGPIIRALLNAPWVSDAQRSAARQLSAFLHSRPVQERALHFGFRPAETSVPLKTTDPQNPFTHLAEFGVEASLPSVAEPPDAAVIRNLLALWTRIHQLP